MSSKPNMSHISFSAAVKNQGNATADAYRVSFFFSADKTITTSDNDPNWYCDMPALAAGATLYCNATLTIPATLTSGTYYLGAYADRNGVVPESDETNNGQAAANAIVISGSTSPLPDLVVTAVTSPSSGTAGDTIDVSATVKNQGNATAGSFWFDYFFSTNATITVSGIDINWGCTIPSLAVSATFTCRGAITVPTTLASGTYYLGAYADKNEVVPESDETNNGRAAANAIVISGGNDSVVTLITLYYQSILGRAPEPAGLTYYQDNIARAQALGDVKPAFRQMGSDFFNSPEYLNRKTSNPEYITTLYKTFLQREPESAGLQFYLDRLAKGEARNNFITDFTLSPEFADFMKRLGF